MQYHVSAETTLPQPRGRWALPAPRTSRRIAVVVVLLLTGAMPAFAQEGAAHQASASPVVTWRAAVGHGTLWTRDVASSKPGHRVDASPVAWEGHGLVLNAALDRATPGRLHRVEVTFAQSSDAVFRTPLAEVQRPVGDRDQRASLRHEYRRYPFLDLGVRGFDIGLGLQSAAEHGTATRNFDPAIEIRTGETSVASGLVAAARLRRWRRLDLEVSWVNGGAIVRTSARHSMASTPTDSRWGVGWLTDLTVRADVRVASGVAVFVSYFDTGRGRVVSRDSSASGRRSWMAGVSHVR